jgi:hypothetical protein
MRWIRYLVLLLAPLALAILEMGHATGFSQNVFYGLLPQLDWWVTLHVLQLLLFGMVGAGIFFLIEGKRGWMAALSRFSAWLFLILYTAFDAIAGIGTGMLINQGRNLPPAQQVPFVEITQRFFHDPLFGGIHSWLSLAASTSWLIAIWAAVWVLFRAGKPIIPLLFLFASGLLLWISHAFPFGPLAFTALFIGTLWLELSKKNRNASIDPADPLHGHSHQ